MPHNPPVEYSDTAMNNYSSYNEALLPFSANALPCFFQRGLDNSQCAHTLRKEHCPGNGHRQQTSFSYQNSVRQGLARKGDRNQLSNYSVRTYYIRRVGSSLGLCKLNPSEGSCVLNEDHINEALNDPEPPEQGNNIWGRYFTVGRLADWFKSQIDDSGENDSSWPAIGGNPKAVEGSDQTEKGRAIISNYMTAKIV